MKLFRLVPAVALFIATAAITPQLRAQSQGNIGLYFNPMATRISNSQTDTTSFSFLGPNNTSRIFWGFQTGGYYDFFHSGPLAAGVTVRLSDQHGNNAAMRDFQVGLRVAGQVGTHLRPYAEVTVGDGNTKPEKATVRINKTAYAVYGGVDYSLARHVDLRAIEVGYGSLTTVSHSTVGEGSGTPYNASTLLSFSTGFVFRF